MRRLFVDTSAWDALVDSSDAHHELALLFRNEAAGHYRLVVTNYILDELLTLLLLNVGYERAVDFKRQLDTLVGERVLQMVWVTEEIAADAWDVFVRFNTDKEWSFTDCVSYTVMKRLGLDEVFAFDHHFAQMGFVCRP
jgi:predicted nucleic acid-binding protein